MDLSNIYCYSYVKVDVHNWKMKNTHIIISVPVFRKEDRALPVCIFMSHVNKIDLIGKDKKQLLI